MYVRMYVCMYVCLYICMYMCMYICICACVCTCVRVCVCAYVCVNIMGSLRWGRMGYGHRIRRTLAQPVCTCHALSGCSVRLFRCRALSEDFAAKSVRPCHMVSGVHYRGYLELHDCITSTIASTSTARKDELPGRL